MIGKGKRNNSVKEAMIRNGAVYFAAVGGAGAPKERIKTGMINDTNKNRILCSFFVFIESPPFRAIKYLRNTLSYFR